MIASADGVKAERGAGRGGKEVGETHGADCVTLFNQGLNHFYGISKKGRKWSGVE